MPHSLGPPDSIAAFDVGRVQPKIIFLLFSESLILLRLEDDKWTLELFISIIWKTACQISSSAMMQQTRERKEEKIKTRKSEIGIRKKSNQKASSYR